MSDEKKIVKLPLPGVQTPEVTLHSLIEDLPNIEFIAVAVQWKNKTYSVGWTAGENALSKASFSGALLTDQAIKRAME